MLFHSKTIHFMKGNRNGETEIILMPCVSCHWFMASIRSGRTGGE
jgi:hypothetical protein